MDILPECLIAHHEPIAHGHDPVGGGGDLRIVGNNQHGYSVPVVQLIEDVHDVVSGLGIRIARGFVGSIHETQENIGPVIRSAAELTELLRETIAARRAEPKDELLSALVTAENQGDSFSEDELYPMCVLLIFAGHVTPPLTSLEIES